MSVEKQNPKNLQGTWNQAIVTFLFPFLLVMGVRWVLIEPFVIPSGSMIPNLLIHDHIFVKKFSYGTHIPFSNQWLWKWSNPQRGDIVVFKYPENPEVYYIKRLIGVPGDNIEVSAGRVRINGEELSLIDEKSPVGQEAFSYFKEKIGEKSHLIRFLSDKSQGEVEIYKVPPGKYFVMGDNRDQSSDSRVWGFVDDYYLVGKAWLVWLSCENTLPSMTFVCDPAQIRYERFFKKLEE